MILKARHSDSGEWGFLEKFDVYNYGGKGYIKALTAVTSKGELAPCYAFRGGLFIPVSEIEEEVGISRYIKAKKPFYAKIKECFVVELKVSVDFNNKIFYPEESSYIVYTVNGNVSNNRIPFKKILNVPKEFDKIVEKPLWVLGETYGDRELFLKGR